MSKTPKTEQEIELHPDAWDRFTKFVKQIAKAGPQHRVKKGGSEQLKRRAPKKR